MYLNFVLRRRFGTKTSVAFASILFLLLLLRYGPGPHLLLLASPVIVISLAVFAPWPFGDRFNFVLRLVVQSVALFALFFLVTVAAILLGFPGSGQVGYGDALQ